MSEVTVNSPTVVEVTAQAPLSSVEVTVTEASAVVLRVDDGAVAAIKADSDWKAGNWDAAYGWGDHSSAGYLVGPFNDSMHGSRSGGALHAAVTTAVNGFMLASDKAKLDGVESGAQVNVGTNLSIGGSGNSRTINSSTGSNTSVPNATTSNAGFMSITDKSKLNGIAAGAQVNTVTSVASKTGAVTLVKNDVGLGNVSNDAQLKISSNLADLQNPVTARANLQMGTAATEDVTTGATDTTAGRLLKVGDFGLGGQSIDSGTNVTDFNTFGIGRRFIGSGLGAANAPTGNRQFGLDVVWSDAPGFRSGHQLLFDSDSATTVVEPRLHFRSYRENRTPPFGEWRELYHTGNLVGTVSQSAGVPTGAVIEEGSNGTGRWTKYADGTLLMQRSVSVDVTSTDVQIFSFPIATIGGRESIAASHSHLSGAPHPSLYNDNIQRFGQNGSAWLIRLSSAGTSSAPNDVTEKLSFFAYARWY